MHSTHCTEDTHLIDALTQNLMKIFAKNGEYYPKVILNLKQLPGTYQPLHTLGINITQVRQ